LAKWNLYSPSGRDNNHFETMLHRMIADPRFNAFYLLTGVTFVGFASGFGVCLFNLDTVDACVSVANNWVHIFQSVGDHIINWAFALFRAVFPH
jgi:hypothetical protein